MSTVSYPVIVTAVIVGVLLVARAVIDIWQAIREADTAATQPLPLAELCALADLLHPPTCQCPDCRARLHETARATHEADQLDAAFEQPHQT